MVKRVLNGYAGIGGNRKYWPSEIKGEPIEVTAVENNQSIADIYKHFFPNDIVIVADAHQFLQDHFEEFDFIWLSPPCPSHSRLRKHTVIGRGQAKPIYPDMKLYQEIIFLKHYFKGKWVVENVISYYEPLIKPYEVQRHYFWSNFIIPTMNDQGADRIGSDGTMDFWIKRFGFDIRNFKTTHRKDQIIRNCVLPSVGLHVFNCAYKEKQKSLGEIKTC